MRDLPPISEAAIALRDETIEACGVDDSTALIYKAFWTLGYRGGEAAEFKRLRRRPGPAAPEASPSRRRRGSGSRA